MLGALLGSRRERQDLVLAQLSAGRSDHVGHHEPTDRQGAGLVEHERVDAIEQLEGGRALDEDPELGAAARGHHDRRRSREPHGARARDDENGHRVGERVERRRRGTEDPPREKRQGREHEHDRDEDRGDSIGQPLDRGARALRVGDELDDPRERRLAPDTRRAEDEAPGAVDGACQYLRIQHLVDGQALAGQHRLVDRGRALGDDPVDGDPLARTNADEVANLHVVGRHVHLGAIPHDPRRARG